MSHIDPRGCSSLIHIYIYLTFIQLKRFNLVIMQFESFNITKLKWDSNDFFLRQCNSNWCKWNELNDNKSIYFRTCHTFVTIKEFVLCVTERKYNLRSNAFNGSSVNLWYFNIVVHFTKDDDGVCCYAEGITTQKGPSRRIAEQIIITKRRMERSRD